MEISLEPIVGGVIKKPGINPENYEYEKHFSEAKELPTSGSIKGKMKHVYKQHGGTCTSNAALACDAYYYHSDAWDPSHIFTYYNQKVMDGSSMKKDSGSCVETALQCVRKYGACSSEVWPNTKPFNKKPSKEAYANGLRGHELTKYYRVKNQRQIKEAICKGYPVAIAMCWPFTTIDGNTWIFCSPDDDMIEECDKGHALVIVGYDDEAKLFEVRNSWGESWANGGYAYIRYSDMKKLIWYEDSYAVVK